MTTLQAYDQFQGLHWETGSVRNYYDYRGVKAPHTGEPFTEAMLLGISGGAVMGYFSFSYEGYDPHVRILTRNTFNPMDAMFERLGVAQNISQTSKPDRAVRNLVDALDDGLPPIVWADLFDLPYNAMPEDDGMWAMFPLVVFGYDQERDTVSIADRARVPLTITTAELASARGKVKKTKYRILTPDPPDMDKLPAAVTAGIWDCIKLYTEAPPKGARNNFGFAAYQRWADVLVKPRMRLSWQKEFPAGAKMYAGLTSTFSDINIFGKDGRAERDVYADFLDEASDVLANPALKEPAQLFRDSGAAWDDLGNALLPDDVPELNETRELMLRRHRLFLDQGGEALSEISQIDGRLDEIKSMMSSDFPLSESEVQAMRQGLRTHVLRIHDIEQQAITAMKEAMT